MFLVYYLADAGYIRALPDNRYLLEVKGWERMEHTMTTGILGFG
jgi:hypothetical protein